MSELVHEVVAGLKEGRFSRLLLNYCRDSISNPSPYTIEHAIRHFDDSSDYDSLYKCLTGEKFRELKAKRLGRRSLWRDDRRGLDLFSRERPDLFRYINIMLLNSVDDAANEFQQQCCHDYDQFLQLNCAPCERKEVGVHYVLGNFFPLAVKAKEEYRTYTSDLDISFPTEAKVELLSYSLGEWQCACGALTEQEQRFHYKCSCNAISGAGNLKDEVPCPHCHSKPSYITCANCKTRVGLKVLSLIDSRIVHPAAELSLPLIARLKIQSDKWSDVIDMHLMNLPLMLGIGEIDNRIHFHPPAAFWVEGPYGERSTRVKNNIIIFDEEIQYDRQKNFRRILEAMLRRTLRGATSVTSLPRYIRLYMRNRVIHSGHPSLTKAFMRRMATLHGKVKTPSLSSVARFGSGLECGVSTSPSLGSGMAVVNSRLLARGELSAPHIEAHSVPIRKSHNERLSSSLSCESNPVRSEYNDGIVAVGAIVHSGQRLVSIEGVNTENLTPEEKLLRAIFGERVGELQDNSLYYYGRNSARVLAVDVLYDPRWEQGNLPSSAGRRMLVDKSKMLKADEYARITVNLAVSHSIAIGDILLDDLDRHAVICDVVNNGAAQELASLSTRVPEIIVSTDHPWAELVGADNFGFVTIHMETMIDQIASSYSSGYYDDRFQRPAMSSGAQVVEALDVEWLLSHSAGFIARELFHVRSDCRDWRKSFHEDLASTGQPSLARYVWRQSRGSRSLTQCPSEAVRFLGHILNGLRIGAVVDGEALGAGIVFEWLGDVAIKTHCKRVKNGDTIEYKTGKPKRGGLFCQEIFGPLVDYKCACGKYNRMKHEGITCDRCGVEVGRSTARREKVGYADLSGVFIHPLLVDFVCEAVARSYGLEIEHLYEVARHNRFMVISSGSPNGVIRFVGELSEGSDDREAMVTGADALLGALAKVPDAEMPCDLVYLVESAFCGFLPIVPPGHRPLLPLSGGGWMIDDLNDLYRQLLNKASRLGKLKELSAPQAIVQNEAREVQKALFLLFRNDGVYHSMVKNRRHRPLSSLSGHLGISFAREETLLDGLLRTSVDFSAVTRLTVGPVDSIDTALIPEELAWDIFRPLILHSLKSYCIGKNYKVCREHVEGRTPEARSALFRVCMSSMILVAFRSSRWRMVALHVQPHAGFSLIVSRRLLQEVGWDHLGQGVRIFSLFGQESQQDASERLLPSKLIEACSEVEVDVDSFNAASLLASNRDTIIDSLVALALERRAQPLGLLERFALCLD